MQISMVDRTVATNSILAIDVIDWGHLPIAIRDRLQTLRDVRGDRHVMVTRLMDEIATTRQEWQRAEGRLRELQARHRDHLPDDHHSVRELADLIAHRSATVARLEARLNELRISWEIAARLSENLELYVRRHCSGGEVRMFEGPPPHPLKNETPTAGMERAARRGRALLADRVETMAAPFPSAVAKKLAREQIARQIEGAKPDVSGLVNFLGPIQFRIAGLPIEQLNLDGVTRVDPVGLLAWLFEKEFIAKIDVEIAAEADDTIALSTEQRLAKLKTIDADILAAGREEAHFSELAGLLPRADLDPRAVLGLPDDMPAFERNAS